MSDQGTEGAGGNRRARIGAYLACLAAFALLSTLSILKFAANNYSIDVGNFLQAFHRSLDGAWMVTTLNGAEENFSRWAGHTEFICALLLPVFALFTGGFTLLILQAAAIAGGGLAVFHLARARWQNETHALLGALAFLAFPFLSHLQLCGFHADPFLIAPYLLAWHFHASGRNRAFWSMVALATSVKEHGCIFNFLLGLVILRSHPRRALALFALSLGQFLILTPVTNWIFRDKPLELNVEAHILPVGQGLDGILSGLLANAGDPAYILKTLAVVALFGWSWIRFPKGLLLVAPLYAALTALSTDALFVHHHFSMLLPALFITLVEACAGMAPARRGRYLAFGLAAPSFLLLAAHPSSQVSTHLREVFLHPEYRNILHYRVTPHDRMTDSLIAAIPGHLAVATEHNLRPKAADREWAFAHPHPKDSLRADRYLFDFFETVAFGSHEPSRIRCAALLDSRDFHVSDFQDGVVVFAKGPGPGGAGRNAGFGWEALAETAATGSAEALPLPHAPGGGIPLAIQPALAKTSDGYLLEVDYRGSFGPAEAVVSIFTRSSKDSVRVLHLPGYLLARLSRLPAGRYRERLPFRGPPDLLDGGWQWELRLYRQHAYLPLAGRPDLVLERRPLGTAVAASIGPSPGDSAELSGSTARQARSGQAGEPPMAPEAHPVLRSRSP